MSQQTHIYRWDTGRAGKAHSASSSRGGKMNSCLVKFEDGYTMVTSRNALKLAAGDLFPVGGAAED